MGRNFHQLREFLESRNSKLIGFVDGANYPPPREKQILAQIFSFFFLVGIAVLFGGETIFKMLGMAEPELYVSMKNNKMTAFLLLFMLNNVGNSMLTTGAFEIFIDGELAFSKLATGRFPTGDDLIRIMAEHNISL
mmetsp:Transcript_18611/g.31014  ORF Transcript_18611/g.31014 Transcript_18611/m.31014 type:complete len:136 (-) Transcript_18611:242-649(-)